MTIYVKNVSGIEIEMTPDEIAERQQEESLNESRIISQHLSAYRFKKENGGIVFNGIPIKTDDRSKLLINGAVNDAILANDPDATRKFKTSTGWVTVTNAQIILIGQMVSAHVQKCFNVEASLENTTFETIQELEAAYEAAYAAA